jgi:hypothetical protein
MTTLVKMAHGVLLSKTFNQDGQCYYSQMGHPTYLSTIFYNLPTYLPIDLPTYSTICLFTYFHIYLPTTTYWPSYLPIYYNLPTYLPTFYNLITHPPTYLPTYYKLFNHPPIYLPTITHPLIGLSTCSPTHLLIIAYLFT